MTLAVVLAAGKGTRMRSSLPKVAHKVAGLPMIVHVHRAVTAVPEVVPLYVLGHESETVRRLLPDDVRVAIQREQRGTGHALSVALDAVGDEFGQLLVLYGDMPLITAGTLTALVARHHERAAKVTLLSATLPDPYGYGRIIRDERGAAQAVIEEKWLTDAQRAIREVNTGLYAIDAAWLRAVLPGLPRHGDDEIYLTDIAERAAIESCLLVVPDADPDEVAGINDRAGLAHAEKIMRRRINVALMRRGVTLIDPEASYIAADAAIGPDTIVEPAAIVDAGVTIGERCYIGAQSRITASTLGDDCVIMASHIERSVLGDRVSVGPFSHLRPGTRLADGVHIGNFAELKNSALGEHTKMGHFSYMGDATVGSHVNVGAGTITANFDGTAKLPIRIGDNVFLGVGTKLRAPVTLGDGSYTGAGSVVLHDVVPGTTVAGVPAREIHRRGKRQGESGSGG